MPSSKILILILRRYSLGQVLSRIVDSYEYQVLEYRNPNRFHSAIFCRIVKTVCPRVLFFLAGPSLNLVFFRGFERAGGGGGGGGGPRRRRVGRVQDCSLL